MGTGMSVNALNQVQQPPPLPPPPPHMFCPDETEASDHGTLELERKYLTSFLGTRVTASHLEAISNFLSRKRAVLGGVCGRFLARFFPGELLLPPSQQFEEVEGRQGNAEEFGRRLASPPSVSKSTEVVP